MTYFEQLNCLYSLLTVRYNFDSQVGWFQYLFGFFLCLPVGNLACNMLSLLLCP